MISAQVLSHTSLTLGWLGYVPLLFWAAARSNRTRYLQAAGKDDEPRE
ncbi:hypothetical protein PS627_02212 [Pseudomonas fluorescens]|nr:hypothetical protein [Pseudomonas fluorescens]CAG8866930.1 hypothetical protein PS627_02212 [Pseudomonas fluorescens]VVP78757.1 hypothetical protein PS910_01762 [Pseudomonas fluorescens]